MNKVRLTDNEIGSRLKRMWSRRHEPMTRQLIRAYLDDRHPGRGVGLLEMANAVSYYYKPGLDDYVIYPAILNYLKLMAMDLEFDTLYGSYAG
jgi:hypothetical protein